MKYPTPKQVRFHFKRLAILRYKLAHALNDAHNAGVISYPTDKYREEGPCSAHSETWDRVLKTTERALAEAMRQEIMKGKG